MQRAPIQRRLRMVSRGGGALAALVFAALLVTSPAYAYHDWVPIYDHYTVNENDCFTRVDPITLIMFGPGIRTSDVVSMVGFHTGWFSRDYSTGGQVTQNAAPVSSPPSGYEGCNPMDDNSASGEWYENRSHVRWNAVGTPLYDASAAGRSINGSTQVVVGTPHYEERTNDGDCGGEFRPGHAVTTFNQTRDHIRQAMQSQHGWEWAWYANDEPRGQCNGWSVWSDGWVNYIETWQYQPTGVPGPGGPGDIG